MTAILTFEGATLDPIGALIAVGVFQALKANHANGLFGDLLGFVGRIGLGVIGGAVGILVLWFLLKKLKLKDTLAIEAIFATVITVAAVCDAIESDTGLVAAIVMGAVLANLRVLEPAKKRPWLLQNTIKFLRGTELPEQHPMLKAIVQFLIGLLFISISATVTPASVRSVLWPSVALVACLVLLVRPAVAVACTLGSGLQRNERVFIGAMDPRGIVAASTASNFSAPLVVLGIGGANHLLPVTFLAIVGTVAIYGLGASPLARALGLQETGPGNVQVPAT